jgi:hypothetical protein
MSGLIERLLTVEVEVRVHATYEATVAERILDISLAAGDSIGFLPEVCKTQRVPRFGSPRVLNINLIYRP